jgi:virulence-associated protein VapD
MFAIAFDMTVAEMARLHPRSVQAGYVDIARVLGLYGLTWRQGSLSVADDEDLAKLFQAIHALQALPLVSGFRTRCPGVSRGAMVRLHRWSQAQAISSTFLAA